MACGFILDHSFHNETGGSTMSLQDELDALRAEFVRTAPTGRAELYDAKVEELRQTFPIEKALKTGDLAPNFRLPNASGRSVSLAGLRRSGPVVVTFYRGGWCPYCNLQLRAYQQVLGEITALGGRLVAISPQLPDGSLSTAEMNKLSFDVLSDVGNCVARSFGLVYSLPDELRAALTSNKGAARHQRRRQLGTARPGNLRGHLRPQDRTGRDRV
jgi:peroxiredoxin